MSHLLTARTEALTTRRTVLCSTTRMCYRSCSRRQSHVRTCTAGRHERSYKLSSSNCDCLYVVVVFVTKTRCRDALRLSIIEPSLTHLPLLYSKYRCMLACLSVSLAGSSGCVCHTLSRFSASPKSESQTPYVYSSLYTLQPIQQRTVLLQLLTR